MALDIRIAGVLLTMLALDITDIWHGWSCSVQLGCAGLAKCRKRGICMLNVDGCSVRAASGRYRLGRKIGSGSFGDIYLGEAGVLWQRLIAVHKAL